MKRLLCSLALLLSCITPSYADEISAHFGDAVVTLTDTLCSSSLALDMANAEYHSKFFNGTVRMTPADKPVALCWMAFPEDDVVLVIDEEGDYGFLPIQAFMAQPGNGI